MDTEYSLSSSSDVDVCHISSRGFCDSNENLIYNREQEFIQFRINKEREKTDKERWNRFEHDVKYLLCELKDPVDIQDLSLLDNIKQSIIVFAMRDKFGEDNNTFLDNMKHQFYVSIGVLEEKHPDIKTFYVKLFMKDFYFGKEETMNG